jgi:hypothetical protein
MAKKTWRNHMVDFRGNVNVGCWKATNAPAEQAGRQGVAKWEKSSEVAGNRGLRPEQKERREIKRELCRKVASSDWRR